MKLNLLKFNIPKNFNFMIIKKYNKITLLVFNKFFKFKLFFNKKQNLKVNKFLNNLEYKNCILKNNFYYIKNDFYKFLDKLNNYYYLKIKFKGKGYKVCSYKKIKLIDFQFGKSHKSMLYYNNIKIKKIKKYKIILLKNNYNDLKKLSCNIIKIKKLNEYTNRGLRNSRQIVIKRRGKKGAFV